MSSTVRVRAHRERNRQPLKLAAQVFANAPEGSAKEAAAREALLLLCHAGPREEEEARKLALEERNEAVRIVRGLLSDNSLENNEAIEQGFQLIAKFPEQP